MYVKGWKDWIAQKKWRRLKKSDWIVIALTGVLLLVIAAPLEKAASSRNGGSAGGYAGGNDVQGTDEEGQAGKKTLYTESDGTQYGGEGSGYRAGTGAKGTAAGRDPQAYAAYLEERLEEVLSQMEGVGEVEVMVTVADAGETVVEKDQTGQTTVTEESDSAGGSRTVSDSRTQEQTVYVENAQESWPFVQKEKLPNITGVVVVAEGAGNPSVISEISDSVMALLPVEVHRIKVVKMCSKEEST